MKTGKKSPISRSNLALLRKELKITQSQLATDLKIDVKTYRDYEKGKAIPGSNILNDMYLYFNLNCDTPVSSDYILGYSQFRSPENDYIGSVTGLSDKAINKLHQIRGMKYCLSALNFIIEYQSTGSGATFDITTFLYNLYSYFHNDLSQPRYYDSDLGNFRDMEYPVDWPYPFNGFLVGSPDKENAASIPVDLVYTHILKNIEKQIDNWKDNYNDSVE